MDKIWLVKGVFFLRDEDLIEEYSEQSRKKSKLSMGEMTLADAMVEVASYNWPQFDQ